MDVPYLLESNAHCLLSNLASEIGVRVRFNGTLDIQHISIYHPPKLGQP